MRALLLDRSGREHGEGIVRTLDEVMPHLMA
jgi:hypothetical protein